MIDLFSRVPPVSREEMSRLPTAEALDGLLDRLAARGTHVRIEAYALTVRTTEPRFGYPFAQYRGLTPGFALLVRTAWVHEALKRETSCAQIVEDTRRRDPFLWDMVKGLELDALQVATVHEVAHSACHGPQALAALSAITATGARARSSLEFLLGISRAKLPRILAIACESNRHAVDVAREAGHAS